MGWGAGILLSIMGEMLKRLAIFPVLKPSKSGDVLRMCVGDTHQEFWSESMCVRVAGGLEGEAGGEMRSLATGHWGYVFERTAV